VATCLALLVIKQVLEAQVVLGLEIGVVLRVLSLHLVEFGLEGELGFVLALTPVGGPRLEDLTV